jgi:hypothetical protein
MTYTARLDITDVYGELHGSVVVLPDDLPPMEPIDGHEVDRTQFLIGKAHPGVDHEQPALKQAQGFLTARRWQIKGEWQPTDEGYAVSVERD